MQSSEEEIRQILCGRNYYRLGEIGRGGQAIVYRVQQVEGCVNGDKHGYPYLACKVGAIAVLRREALLLKQLQHPFFPRFEGYWEQRDRGFLLMEYVPGKTLENYVNAGQITLYQLESWSVQLAEAILGLHHFPGTWLYRDLKPANIIIREDGRLKLVDLGCACPLSEVGESMAGTPGYSSPEQFGTPELMTETSDLYSYGKLLERLLQNCRIHGFREWVRYRRWQHICHRCLSVDTGARPDSAQQILASVQKY